MPKKVNRPKAKKPKESKTRMDARIVTAPVATSKVIKQRGPKFTRTANTITVTHRELCMPIVATTAFIVQSVSINPGNPTMFPWLSSQALGWERYRFKKLKFSYVSRAPTTLAGSIILAPDYDAADAAPANEAVACSYLDSASGTYWTNFDLVCNHEALLGGVKSKYVRVGTLEPNLDVKTYDSGNLFVCCVDSSTNNYAAGKLWVEYTVELIVPHTIPVRLPTLLTTVGGQTSTPFSGTQTIEGPLLVPAAGKQVNLDYLVPGTKYAIDWAAYGQGNTITPNATLAFGQLVNLAQNGLDVTVGTTLSGYMKLVTGVFTALATKAAFNLNIDGGSWDKHMLSVVPISSLPGWYSQFAGI